MKKNVLRTSYRFVILIKSIREHWQKGDVRQTVDYAALIHDDMMFKVMGFKAKIVNPKLMQS